jgi:16S rRNA (cytidine1402-2'-O)-methyltransferase
MLEVSKNFFIIATPIGNLEDITHRALRILQEVDLILCEDTRITGKLLHHYNITTPMMSYHAQSNNNKEEKIIQHLQEDKTLALVSDAGTPTISDPGVKLISRIRNEFKDIKIISIPGASAVITALSTTGFEGNQFVFYGFLPHKKGRNKIFSEIESSSRIGVFYESPHRLMKTLEELSNRLSSERKICVARELTKIHEETPIGTSLEILKYFQDNPDKVRGECVLIIDK